MHRYFYDKHIYPVNAMSDDPGRKVGRLPDNENDTDSNSDTGYVPPGQRSYEEREKDRVESISDEEQRREEAEEQGIDLDNDSDGSGSKIDFDELEEEGSKDNDSNKEKSAVEKAEEEAGVNEAVQVETDRFGNVESAETIDFRDLEDRNPDNQGPTRDIPGVDPQASQKDRRKQRKAQRRGQTLAESRRIKNNLLREQRFTENRLQRLENLEGNQEITVENERTTVSKRRNQLRQRKREINQGLEQTGRIRENLDVPDAPTVEETTRERREQEAIEEKVDELTVDDNPVMTAPGENPESLRPGDGTTLPEIGQQEFAGGTENINYDFREERKQNTFESDLIVEDQSPLDFGFFLGKNVETGLEDTFISDSQATFLGEQTTKVGTIAAASIEGLESIGEGVASFVSNPGKSVSGAVDSFDRDLTGISAGEATDADVRQGLQSYTGRDTLTRSGVESRTRQAQALADVILAGAGGTSILRSADRFVLRNPIDEVPNPTPDVPGVKQADNRLTVRLPVERRETNAPEIQTITDTSSSEVSTGTSQSSLESLRRELDRVEEDDLPDLQDNLQDSEGNIIQESQEDISGTGEAPQQVARDRGEPLEEIEEGLTQEEIQVLTNRDVGFEDVNPERQTDTGGFERQQVDELRGQARRPTEGGFDQFIDEVEDRLGNSRKGQLRLTTRETDLETRTRDVDADEPDLERRNDFDDESSDIEPIENRRQTDLDSDEGLDNPISEDFDKNPLEGVEIGLGLGISKGTETSTGVDQGQGQGQSQAQSVDEEKDFSQLEEITQFTGFDNTGFDRGNNRDTFGPKDNDRTRIDRRRRRDRDLPDEDFEDNDNFVAFEDQFEEDVGSDLEDQFAPSLTAELENIQAGEDFDEKDFTGTGFDIRPLI